MPIRLLREGIIDSEAVNSLSPEAEVFYRRLMSVVDDFGRFDGRTSVLRGRLYALQLEKVREANLERWIAECVKARLIRLYYADSKPYISFLKLGEPRAKASKYPPPPDEEPFASESRCKQTHASAPYSSSGSDSSSGAGSAVTTPPFFERFWEAYPRKENRADAEAEFRKLAPSPELFEKILAAIALQVRKGCLAPAVDRDGKSVVPHAAKWLVKRRWEDIPPKTLVDVNAEASVKRATESAKARAEEKPIDPAELQRIKESIGKRIPSKSHKPQE